MICVMCYKYYNLCDQVIKKLIEIKVIKKDLLIIIFMDSILHLNNLSQLYWIQDHAYKAIVAKLGIASGI